MLTATILDWDRSICRIFSWSMTMVWLGSLEHSVQIPTLDARPHAAQSTVPKYCEIVDLCGSPPGKPPGLQLMVCRCGISSNLETRNEIDWEHRIGLRASCSAHNILLLFVGALIIEETRLFTTHSRPRREGWGIDLAVVWLPLLCSTGHWVVGQSRRSTPMEIAHTGTRADSAPQQLLHKVHAR